MVTILQTVMEIIEISLRAHIRINTGYCTFNDKVNGQNLNFYKPLIATAFKHQFVLKLRS